MGGVLSRIGIDLGGTKIEALLIDQNGRELLRRRVPTPRNDYRQIVAAIKDLVDETEAKSSQAATVGVGIPGTISHRTGLVKNANSTWLNGQSLREDLEQALGRRVRVANDANCLAVSEATDGAAAGQQIVFAAILGTGCGAGLAFGGTTHSGRNGIAGEWGHNSLPFARSDESPGPTCYCGKNGCLETWISGAGLEQDHKRVTGRSMTGTAIVAAAELEDANAVATLERYEDRLARGLAHVINMLDPDVIVLGGGISQVSRLYRTVPERLAAYVFGSEVDTPILKALHGDSSGVRGAAWLWPASRPAL